MHHALPSLALSNLKLILAINRSVLCEPVIRNSFDRGLAWTCLVNYATHKPSPSPLPALAGSSCETFLGSIEHLGYLGRHLGSW